MQLFELTAKATELSLLTANINLIERKVESLKDEILDAMEEMGLKELVTVYGDRIYLDNKIHAAISKTNRDRACQWLRDNGHGDVIKNKVAVEFLAEEDAAATSAVCALEHAGFTPNRESTVHHMTLTALVKELLAGGEEVPFDLLGVVDVKKVEVKLK
jgi:hypothetical protein